jgi:hypothetical protein
MNVISMMHVIDFIPNPVIRESALPNFLPSTDDAAEFMGVCAFDQLDRALDGYVDRRSQEKMNVLRHDNEGVQAVTAFATIPVKRFQEDVHIDFDEKQLSTVEGRESHEISPRTLNWHEWNSCPSRLFVAREFLFWERGV